MSEITTFRRDATIVNDVLGVVPPRGERGVPFVDNSCVYFVPVGRDFNPITGKVAEYVKALCSGGTPTLLSSSRSANTPVTSDSVRPPISGRKLTRVPMQLTSTPSASNVSVAGGLVKVKVDRVESLTPEEVLKGYKFKITAVVNNTSANSVLIVKGAIPRTVRRGIGNTAILEEIELGRNVGADGSRGLISFPRDKDSVVVKTAGGGNVFGRFVRHLGHILFVPEAGIGLEIPFNKNSNTFISIGRRDGAVAESFGDVSGKHVEVRRPQDLKDPVEMRDPGSTNGTVLSTL